MHRFVWFVERGRWPLMQRQGRARGPSAHSGLVCLFSSRSRPPMSRSVRIKRQTRGQRQGQKGTAGSPGAFKHTGGSESWQRQRMWLKRGVEKQERRGSTEGGEGGNQAGAVLKSLLPQDSRQRHPTAGQQWDDENRNRKKDWMESHKRRCQIWDFTKIKHSWKEGYTETGQINKTRAYVHVWLKTVCESK